MGNAAKAITGVAVEQAGGGMQVLLNPTPVASLPASLTNSISASAKGGMRLVIMVQNHTVAGTIGLAGKAPYSVATLTETSSSFALNSENPGEVAIYVSANAYGSIDASGVTVTGLTNGTVTIFGIQAAARQLVGQTALSDKNSEFSPLEQRGSFDADYHLIGLVTDPDFEHQGAFYSDSGLWMPLGAYNNAPTVAGIPAAGVAVLASTSVVTGSSISASLQPTAPGMVLQCVIGGAPATAATVSVTGVNLFGQTVTEVIVPSTKTAGTWVSQTVFTSIASSGIVYGAFGGSATLTVTAFFGFSYTGNPGDAVNSYSMEQYDSTGNFAAPYCLLDEWSIELPIEKEATQMAKGIAQAVFPLGDVSNTASQISSFAQPLDVPIPGWRSVMWLDPASNAPGTTAQQDIRSVKLTFKINWQQRHTSWGNPPNRYWNRAYRKRRLIEVEVQFDMTSTTFQQEYQAFKQRRTRYLQVHLRGRYMGTDSGTDYYEGAKFILPLKWLDVPERSFAGDAEAVDLTLKGRCKYDSALGYSHKITWYSRFGNWNQGN